MRRLLAGRPIPLEWVPADVPKRAFGGKLKGLRKGSKLRQPDELEAERHKRQFDKARAKVTPRGKIVTRHLALLSMVLEDEWLWEVFTASPDAETTPLEERQGTYLEVIVREFVVRHGNKKRPGEQETVLQRLLMAAQQGNREHHPKGGAPSIEIRTPAHASGRMGASRAVGPSVGGRRRPPQRRGRRT